MPGIVLCARNTTVNILDTVIPLKEFTVRQGGVFSFAS